MGTRPRLGPRPEAAVKRINCIVWDRVEARVWCRVDTRVRAASNACVRDNIVDIVGGRIWNRIEGCVFEGRWRQP
jgi:hypothetical protein